MDLDTQENRELLKLAFPKIEDEGGVFHIKSPATSCYNCIAWAMGFDDRWVDYILNSKKKWWPKNVPLDWHPDTLIAAFEAVGFEKCNNGKLEDGFDKVALYKVCPFFDPLTDRWINDYGWSHAAKILEEGVYHSKIGPSFDIYHRNGDVFEGTDYGEIYQYMRRPEDKKVIVERIKVEEPRYDMPDNILSIVMNILSDGI